VIKSMFSKAILVCAALMALTGCDKVPAGNVGVKFHLLGGDKGVDTEELSPGRYWIGINEELYLFPTFTQTYVWTVEAIDGDSTNESITFQDKDGLRVNADIGISYSVDPDKVTTLFQKYRKGIEEITDTYLRNMVRDALISAASTRSIESIYGPGKAHLLAEVEKNVSAVAGPLGIHIEKLYWAGELRLPEAVTAAINNKLKANQFAQQRANEVAAAKAEADKAIETARGTAESQLIVARAEADSIRLKGEALSQNPRLIEYKALEQWDGKLPQMTGNGAIPFIQVAPGK
jgi:regulator of protease activity HflC (stomatin/prohibitin superfamily)